MTNRKQTLDALPLNHPLEPFTAFIDGLITRFSADCPTSRQEAEFRLWSALSTTVAAEGVIVLQQENQTWVSKSSQDDSCLAVPQSPVQSSVQSSVQSPVQSHISQAIASPEVVSLMAQFLGALSQRTGSTRQTLNSPALNSQGLNGLGQDHHGLYQIYSTQDGSKALVLIPLRWQAPREMLCLWGVPPDSGILSEVCGRVVFSLYTAIQQVATLRAPLIEAVMLDDLRRCYGFLPIALYNRRFDLFRERLTQMVVYFEPVLRLDPDYLYIDSWEALARDPEYDSAPVDLFAAAELWGDRFLIELDSYFLEQAVKSYRDACQFAVGRRKEDIRELSVNVYPQSLVRSAYYKAIERVIREKLIQPEKLILEISEKFPLPHPENEGSDASMEAFRRHLNKYVRDLKVGFAIDDFGVGHASVSRLTGLNPAHVKVDRNILHQDQELSEITLRFVLDLASSKRLRAPKVVVEGFDRNTSITLQQLYQLGIRYVQGHIIGKAGPELNRLRKDQYEYLKGLINEI